MLWRRNISFALSLSIASADASTLEPVYGIPISSSIPWMQPSSPRRPCSARNATSISAVADGAVDRRPSRRRRARPRGPAPRARGRRLRRSGARPLAPRSFRPSIPLRAASSSVIPRSCGLAVPSFAPCSREVDSCTNHHKSPRREAVVCPAGHARPWLGHASKGHVSRTGTRVKRPTFGPRMSAAGW